jgi:hypothetical protein
MKGRTPLPPIDFAGIAAKLGDLRALIARDLGDPGRGDKFHSPFHGNGQERTPSLAVYSDHYHCFACGAHGDGLHWVAWRDKLTLVRAAKQLDPSVMTAADLKSFGGTFVEETPAPSPAAERVTPRRAEARPETWRDAEWQDRASGLIAEAEEILWSRMGRPALDWLRRRKLTDVTIRRFRLGFLPVDTWTRPIGALLDDDGRPRGLFAPRGVTFPWAAPGAWYAEGDGEPEGPRWCGLNVRRLAEDFDARLPDGVKKYHTAKGSGRGYLYPHPTIERTQGVLPMLLVEGEPDALIGNQEVGHILNVATAGSASVRNLRRESRASLARCPWLFLALDHDGPGVGGVRAWREAYPTKARRVLLPHGKDLNDFCLGGGDLVGWLAEIRAGLMRHRTPAPSTNS